jgi:TRAP transporter TAXI family solute receptor
MRNRWIVHAGLALAFSFGPVAVQAQERITIGTGGTAGLFYVIGAGMAEVINKHLPGVTARAEVTGASVENVRRVAAGQQTIGFSSSSTLYEAKKGEKAFQSPQPVAAIAYLYPAILQIAVISDKFKTMDDLKDATINLGPPGSNSAVLAERLLAAYGVFNKDKARYLSYAEGTKAMLNGTIDAAVVLAGAPTAALVELAAQRDMRLLSVEPARVDKMLKEYSFYQVYTIAPGTYKGQTAPVAVINDPAVLFTNEKADEKLIYDIAKTLFTHLDELGAVHVQAKEIKLETATRTPIDLHPGAKRFFDEAMKK